MSIENACRAAIVVAAICLSVPVAHAAAAPPQVASEVGTSTPGDLLGQLAGKTFGFMAKEGQASLLIRFEATPGRDYRVIEINQSGTNTTTIAANQRGPRWKGKFIAMPIDFKAKETVTAETDGSLVLAWSAWGSSSARRFRLLPDGSLARSDGAATPAPDGEIGQLFPLDAAQEKLLLDQIAIETAIFNKDVAERVKVLMAESEQRRKENWERFWNGLGQATMVIATVAAEVAAESASNDGGSPPGIANPAFGQPGSTLPASSAEQAARAAPEAPTPAAAPLRFVMMIGLVPRDGDTVNPTCYSNLVTRPGPPGWGASAFLPSGAVEQATQSVESMRDRFVAQCRATGREITSLGNFTYVWNRYTADEQQVADAGPRFKEDVLVGVD